MADQINIHVTYEDTKRVIPCPKGEVVQGFAILFIQAFSDVLPREVEPSDVKFQLYDEKSGHYKDLQGNEPLKDGMKLRALILRQPPSKPHPIHPNTIYRLWSPVSKKNDGVMMRNPSTNIVKCDGTFISGDDTLMETIDETDGQTPAFSLVFKDGASTKLALTAHGKGNAVTANVIAPPVKTPDDSIFEPKYFWSYTMFKQRNSDYYLGCDASGTLTLVENWYLEYPNPQALFIANKPKKST